MTDFFTSDHHFYHRNIIDYCKRGFATVEEMHEMMIARWNETVGPNDLVYHLGDFGMGNATKLRAVFERLNGKVVLIRGNHDCISKTAFKERVGFVEVYDELEVDGMKLCHLPYYGDTQEEDRFKNKRPILDSNQWLICGHVHDLWRFKGRQLNVGVDVWGYYPLSLERIREEIKAKEIEYAKENSQAISQ